LAAETNARAESRASPQPTPHPLASPSEIAARQPLFWAALAFACGIWIGRITWRPPSWWLVAACVFAAAALYFLRRRPQLARVLALGACVFAGALAVQIPESSSESSATIWLGDGQDVTVTAHAISEGNLEVEAPGSWRQRIDVQTEQIDSESRTQRTSFGLRLSIYSKWRRILNFRFAPDIATTNL
jgi:Domain of unknown function (DUF4131)